LEAKAPDSELSESLGVRIVSLLVLFIATSLIVVFVSIVFRFDLLLWIASIFKR
jgi:hypothetical protein